MSVLRQLITGVSMPPQVYDKCPVFPTEPFSYRWSVVTCEAAQWEMLRRIEASLERLEARIPA